MIEWSFLFSCLIESLQIPVVHNKRDARNLIHIHYFHVSLIIWLIFTVIPGHNRVLGFFLPK